MQSTSIVLCLTSTAFAVSRSTCVVVSLHCSTFRRSKALAGLLHPFTPAHCLPQQTRNLKILCIQRQSGQGKCMPAFDHVFSRNNDMTCAVADYPRSNMTGEGLTQCSRLSSNIMQSYKDAASYHAFGVNSSILGFQLGTSSKRCLGCWNNQNQWHYPQQILQRCRLQSKRSPKFAKQCVKCHKFCATAPSPHLNLSFCACVTPSPSQKESCNFDQTYSTTLPLADGSVHQPTHPTLAVM